MVTEKIHKLATMPVPAAKVRTLREEVARLETEQGNLIRAIKHGVAVEVKSAPSWLQQMAG